MVMSFGLKIVMSWLQVTFFWNGNRSGYFKEDMETYVEIPSDTVPFNEAPEMKAREITEAGKEALLSGKYDMVRVNYANPGTTHSQILGICSHAVALHCHRTSRAVIHIPAMCPAIFHLPQLEISSLGALQYGGAHGAHPQAVTGHALGLSHAVPSMEEPSH